MKSSQTLSYSDKNRAGYALSSENSSIFALYVCVLPSVYWFKTSMNIHLFFVYKSALYILFFSEIHRIW